MLTLSMIILITLVFCSVGYTIGKIISFILFGPKKTEKVDKFIINNYNTHNHLHIDENTFNKFIEK